MKDKKIVITGGAGLVGQNLVARLKNQGYKNIVVLDKHRANVQILKKTHPDITVDCVDLAELGNWSYYFNGADVAVILHAQIGSLNPDEFIRNNITSTIHVLEVINKYHVPYTVHISSSVVESVANDDYTNTKREQEMLVVNSGIKHVVLRPTLMFGWFDRKHLGWLSRFMKKVPVFPIPGHGRYMRQPLYVGDFCNIIISCIEKEISGEVYNITGRDQVDYIDIIREIKRSSSAKAYIIKLPYGVFYGLLKFWSIFDKNPPFTPAQLRALVAKDEFEVIDWPKIFEVKSTPFSQAVDETFKHPVYSSVTLEF